MSHPDSTAAFAEDTHHDTDTITQLRQRVAYLEQHQATSTPDTTNPEDTNNAPGTTTLDSDDGYTRHANYRDYSFRFKLPHQGALMAFSMGTNSGNDQLGLRVLNKFMSTYIHPDDYDTLLSRMISADDPITMEDFTSIVEIIAEQAQEAITTAQDTRNGAR